MLILLKSLNFIDDLFIVAIISLPLKKLIFVFLTSIGLAKFNFLIIFLYY